MRYVFWAYDLCPYVLGDKLSTPIRKGFAYPDGYGGMGFKPIRILKGERGKQALKDLKALQAAYREQSYSLKKMFADQVTYLLK